MKEDDRFPKRRSIRLKDYDYSTEGAYFVTICTKHAHNLFGRIEKEHILLNYPGKMIEKWWLVLENKFPTIVIDEYVIMPNHLHGILFIVGADQRVCPDHSQAGAHAGAPLRMPLSKVIQWFKTMTTNEYIRGVKNQGWWPFDKKLWQRNYYEHVIRHEIELYKLREYIINNPVVFDRDQ